MIVNTLLDVDDFKKPEFREIIDEMHGMMQVSPDGYDTIYGKHRSFIEGTKHWEYCQLLLNVQLNSDMRVLDAGCSRSIFPVYVAKKYGCEVIGIDNANDDRYKIDPHLGNKFGVNVKYKRLDLRDTKFPDDHFDCTFCVSVLEHVKNPKKGMNELVRITKPNGTIALTIDFIAAGEPVPITGGFDKKMIKDIFTRRSDVELVAPLNYNFENWKKYCKKVNSHFRSVKIHSAVSLILKKL